MGEERLNRLSYLVYRCYRCGRLLTNLEILKKWEKAEDNGGTVLGLCPCGSRHITPTNAKWWEELLLPRVWRVWWVFVVRPWLGI